MTNKNIAVIVGHSLVEYHGNLLNGIISQAKKLGYNVLVFSLFSITNDITPYQLGEENIYRLINFDKIAGIVYIDISIWADQMRSRVYEYITENFSGPVICANSNEPNNCLNQCIDEIKTFSNMTEHLITCHGMKKIYCLTGFKGNELAENRLAAYRYAMEKHGLEVKDSYIFYGDFWENAAKELASDIAEGKIERPEAVVCGNDSMAISLTNALIDRGIVVPDDIAVTGYDAVSETYENIPSITTYKVSFATLGARCVCKLHQVITGEKTEPIFTDEGYIVDGESCGCKKNMVSAKLFSKLIHDKREREELIHSGVMIERLTVAESFDQCLKYIAEHLYLLASVSELAICFDEKWNTFSENDSEYTSCGYSENMNLRLYTKAPYSDLYNVSFPSAEMVPPPMRENEPYCCYFVPIHFGDRCFGYVTVKYKSDSESHDKVLRTWIKNVNTALEYLRVKERYDVINKRLYIGSIRDSLTGIYNRHGYKQFSEEIFALAKENHKKLMIIAVDMDRLKYINDTFGHTEGDNAITIIAQALQSSSGNSEKCARTGGDEFVIIGCYDYIDEAPEFYRKRIEGYLARYNEISQKDYCVEASIGCFCGYVDEYKNVDECYAIADKLMYQNKTERKKQRTE